MPRWSTGSGGRRGHLGRSRPCRARSASPPCCPGSAGRCLGRGAQAAGQRQELEQNIWSKDGPGAPAIIRAHRWFGMPSGQNTTVGPVLASSDLLRVIPCSPHTQHEKVGSPSRDVCIASLLKVSAGKYTLSILNVPQHKGFGLVFVTASQDPDA